MKQCVLSRSLKLVLLSFSLAAASSAIAINSTPIPENEDAEYVEVVNKMPIYRLERLVFEAKMDFYKVFNEINDIKDYHIICNRVNKTGSNFKRHQCEPYYFKEKRAELRRQLGNYDIGRMAAIALSEQEVAAATKDTKADADAHTIKLIEENPELMERYLAFKKINLVYRARKANKN